MKHTKSTHLLVTGRKSVAKFVSDLRYLEFYLPKFINTMEFKADEENKFYQKGKTII